MAHDTLVRLLEIGQSVVYDNTISMAHDTLVRLLESGQSLVYDNTTSISHDTLVRLLESGQSLVYDNTISMAHDTLVRLLESGQSLVYDNTTSMEHDTLVRLLFGRSTATARESDTALAYYVIDALSNGYIQSTNLDLIVMFEMYTGESIQRSCDSMIILLWTFVYTITTKPIFMRPMPLHTEEYSTVYLTQLYKRINDTSQDSSECYRKMMLYCQDARPNDNNSVGDSICNNVSYSPRPEETLQCVHVTLTYRMLSMRVSHNGQRQYVTCIIPYTENGQAPMSDDVCLVSLLKYVWKYPNVSSVIFQSDYMCTNKQSFFAILSERNIVRVFIAMGMYNDVSASVAYERCANAVITLLGSNELLVRLSRDADTIVTGGNIYAYVVPNVTSSDTHLLLPLQAYGASGQYISLENPFRVHDSSTLYTGMRTSDSVDTMNVDAEDYTIATRVLRVSTYPNSPFDGNYATSPLCVHIIKDGVTKRRSRYVCTLLRTVLRNDVAVMYAHY